MQPGQTYVQAKRSTFLFARASFKKILYKKYFENKMEFTVLREGTIWRVLKT